MRILDGNFQINNKLFVMIHPKDVCKFEFADYLWLIFFDPLQSDILVIEIITFQKKIVVTKWKHGIGSCLQDLIRLPN